MANCNTRTMEAPSAAFSTDSLDVPADGGYALAIGHDPARRSVTVTADSDNLADVYVVPGPQSPAARGYRLTPGAGYVLGTAAPVYVATLPGAVAGRVNIVAETGSVG